MYPFPQQNFFGEEDSLAYFSYSKKVDLAAPMLDFAESHH